MSSQKDYQQIMEEIIKLFHPVFSQSPQGMYIYLDDVHRISNQRFAEFLGYASVEAWRSNKNPAEDVAEEDREKEEKAYYDAAEGMKAVSLVVTYQRQDGEKVLATVIMVPFVYQEQTVVLHFVNSLDKQ